MTDRHNDQDIIHIGIKYNVGRNQKNHKVQLKHILLHGTGPTITLLLDLQSSLTGLKRNH